MTTKINLLIYQFIFVITIVTTFFKCNNDDLPWPTGMIIILLCNIALMINGEYQRCIDRDAKKDKAFNNEI